MLVLGVFLMLLSVHSSLSLTSCISRYTPFYTGLCIDKLTDCTGALLNNLCPGIAKCCVPDINPQSSDNFVSQTDMTTLFGDNPRIRSVANMLKPPKSNPTCFEKSNYLAQLAHETDDFLYSEELGPESSFAKYNNKLGNGPNEGAKYKGRGFIQITGKDNYREAGTYLGLNLVDDPELAAFPSVAAKIAVWYWNVATGKNLNTYADGTFYSYSMLTAKINGGITNLLDRTLILEKIMTYFGCGSLTKGAGESCSSGQGTCIPLCVAGLESKNYCGCDGTTKNGLCAGPSNIKCCLNGLSVKDIVDIISTLEQIEEIQEIQQKLFFN